MQLRDGGRRLLKVRDGGGQLLMGLSGRMGSAADFSYYWLLRALPNRER